MNLQRLDQGQAYLALCCAKGGWMYGGIRPETINLGDGWQLWFHYGAYGVTANLAVPLPGGEIAVSQVVLDAAGLRAREYTQNRLADIVQKLEIHVMARLGINVDWIPYTQVLAMWPRQDAPL